MTPFSGMWRMENGECRLPFCRLHVVRMYALFTRLDSNTVSHHVKEATPGEKQEACGETFSENPPFFTRGGEKLGFPFSENDPPPFKERVPRQHSPTSKNGRKEV